MSVAAHMTIQLVGLVTGLAQISPVRPQRHHAYPGQMDVDEPVDCDPDREYVALTATAIDPTAANSTARRTR